MNVLITGYAGFIGYHLTKKLLNFNLIKKIYAVDNFNNYYDVNLKFDRVNELKKNKNYHKISAFNFDIANDKKLSNFFSKKKIDIIVHLAAQAGIRYSLVNPKSYIKSNINGFFNMIELCRKKRIKTFIYASSSSVYGNLNKTPFTENSITNKPQQLYAASKLSNELIAYSYSHLFPIRTIGLRFFTVYGPFGRPDMAIFKFVNLLFKNKTIELYNKGNLVRDFTYIDDIVNGICKILKSKQILKNNPHNAEVYNLGKGSPLKINNLLKLIEELTGKKAKIKFKVANKSEMEKTYCSISKFKNYFGYTPNIDIKQGLKQFINWYIKYYKIKK